MPLAGLLPYTDETALMPKTLERFQQGKPWLTDRMDVSEQEMRRLAGNIEDTEGQRYQQGLNTLSGAFNQSQRTLSQGVDAGLLFSRASDSIGARSKSQLDALRTSLGARGMNPNSGAAGGILSRLMFEREGALTGATRDIAIDNQRQRQVNAAVNFANALQLANYTNAPVGGARLETEQNIFEGLLAQKGIAEQRKSAKEANKTDLLGGLIGAGSSILGGLLGGL
jgi:hypothetical protein